MLADELTLLDGTEVITVGAAARLTSQDFWVAYDVIADHCRPETVLDGVRYYARDTVLPLVAGAR